MLLDGNLFYYSPYEWDLIKQKPTSNSNSYKSPISIWGSNISASSSITTPSLVWCLLRCNFQRIYKSSRANSNASNIISWLKKNLIWHSAISPKKFRLFYNPGWISMTHFEFNATYYHLIFNEKTCYMPVWFIVKIFIKISSISSIRCGRPYNNRKFF